ncbi:MAG: hypothetical protein WD738_13185, partial [Pirellulales bacterium]
MILVIVQVFYRAAASPFLGPRYADIAGKRKTGISTAFQQAALRQIFDTFSILTPLMPDYRQSLLAIP